MNEAQKVARMALHFPRIRRGHNGISNLVCRRPGCFADGTKHYQERFELAEEFIKKQKEEKERWI